MKLSHSLLSELDRRDAPILDGMTVDCRRRCKRPTAEGDEKRDDADDE
jgi:hypothetical protein